MDGTGFPMLEDIKDKKIFNPEKSKSALNFENLWKTLEPDQLIYITFLRRFG
jgi:hypothetical protein